ncbi:hypothetical protein [Arachidicoccus sp.]|jgi:hypothetical protein|uniref:hypothetical protein n=1 Tax=Arachidicoccus sp. TaxID=1872624 RepID=UPI003D1DF37E
MPVKLHSTIQAIAQKMQQWMLLNFDNNITNALQDTQFQKTLPIAIACEEVAYKILLWIDHYSTDIVLARCVFDASGDFPGTTRTAFPKNRQAFENVYGLEFSNMLIEEGNKQRAMPQVDAPNGYPSANYLYKGYGIFQRDLQFVKQDKDFFFKKEWHDINTCLDRLIKELKNYAKTVDSLHEIIVKYNGTGPKAEQYALNVESYMNAMKEA